MVMKGSLVHCCIGSLRALLYTLCMFALKSAKLYRLLYILGDRHEYLLIHIWMLASMRTQNIFVSQVYFVSLVAQSDAYFSASGRSYSMLKS